MMNSRAISALNDSIRLPAYQTAKCLAVLVFATLLAACGSIQETEEQARQGTSEQWQSVSLGDHKMGYRHILKESTKSLIKTTETLSVTLSQPGSRDREISTTLSYHESKSGKPIALYKTIVSDTANHQMSAIVKGSSLALRLKESAKAEYYPIEQPFYLPEGLRLALLKQSGAVRQLEYYSWNFSTRQFNRTQLTVKAYSSPDQPDYAWHIQRATVIGGSSKYTDIFADKEFRPLTERSHSNGDEVLIASCDKACAMASFVPNTHVYRQLIQSPYKITDTALNGKIRYRLVGDFSLLPPTTYEQEVKRTPQGTELVICQDCGTEAPPSAADLRVAVSNNYWLPAQNPIFKNLVTEILPDRNSDVSGQMQRLTRYVTRHMSDEASYSGYATALEAYESKQGDCTEHALLLATLARAAEIPTRVVFGLAYTNERFLGRKYVFVPHAWVQAWTGERWESYDSGLGAFTAGYIALGLSNGDQADILKINEQLHKIHIESAIQIRSR
ncbi:transglutaminase-like domain-containing protein [Zhongshania arctica]|uniref:Transglutaminase family protein n=1 Tax=Zhongshania arctica TaxID=3238302 RepID=A0ABV3TUZ0_9GAMM